MLKPQKVIFSVRQIGSQLPSHGSAAVLLLQKDPLSHFLRGRSKCLKLLLHPIVSELKVLVSKGRDRHLMRYQR